MGAHCRLNRGIIHVSTGDNLLADPTMDQMILIAGLGVTTFCAQYCMISAYKHAEVTVVTPFEYFRIIFAAIAGFLIFSEVPDQWTIWGGTLICASTLFIAYREAYKKKGQS